MYNREERKGKAVVAVEYRPFWFRIFDPRLTGKLIAISVLLSLTAFANLFEIGKLVSQGNTGTAPVHIVAALVYGLAVFGMLKVNRWARYLAIAICIVSVFQGGIMMLYIDLFQGMLTVVIYGLSAIYLLSAKCRAVFYPPAEEVQKDQG